MMMMMSERGDDLAMVFCFGRFGKDGHISRCFGQLSMRYL